MNFNTKIFQKNNIKNNPKLNFIFFRPKYFFFFYILYCKKIILIQKSKFFLHMLIYIIL